MNKTIKMNTEGKQVWVVMLTATGGRVTIKGESRQKD